MDFCLFAPFILIPRFAHAFLLVFCSYLYRICLGISDTFDSFLFIATTRFAYAFLPFFRSYSYTVLLTHSCWYFVHTYIQRICLGISVKIVHIYTGFAYAFLPGFRHTHTRICLRISASILFISTTNLLRHFC